MKPVCWEARLNELASLKPGWDSYDAPSPSPSAVAKARDLMTQLSMYPALDGGLTIEMGDVELLIGQDGRVRVVNLDDEARSDNSPIDPDPSIPTSSKPVAGD